MKWWDDICEWLDKEVLGEHRFQHTRRQLDGIIQGEQEQQRERDALIAESFAKPGKGAQGVQCAMAVRIATAIRGGRSA